MLPVPSTQKKIQSWSVGDAQMFTVLGEIPPETRKVPCGAITMRKGWSMCPPENNRWREETCECISVMGLSDFSGMDTSHFWTSLWLKAPTSTWTWGWDLNIPNDGAEKGQGESQKDQNDWPLDTPILPLSMVINMIPKQTCLQKTYRSYSCFAVSNRNKPSHISHFGDRFPDFSMGAPFGSRMQLQKWVCLKIVYPYIQWLMIIIPIKWL